MILDEMLQSVTDRSHNLSNKGAMEEKLQQCLQEERKGYLLVLDDVWNTDEQLWKSVETSLAKVTRFTKSRVLVTTQSSSVASTMRVAPAHHLQDLGDADAWMLFKEKAFANKSEEQVSGLEDIGRRIFSKCGGLPLAITTMGSMLASMERKAEWELIERSEIWDLPINQSKIIPWLLLSFHHLPNATVKQCLVHCSILMEKGAFVQQSKLIQAWMAQGFIESKGESGMSMEEIGDTCVRNLVANGLLQTDIRSNGCYLWMHDLIHDLTFFISKDTSLIVREDYDLQNASELEHLRICGEITSSSKHVIPKGKALSKLHILICTQTHLSIDFAAQARYLRDLWLMDCGLKEVPSSIGRLKHLRYLRTLPRITLEHKEGFEIKELRSLQLLSGEIAIRQLDNICCKEDVVEASLNTKPGITHLSLVWPFRKQTDMVSNDEEIMDGLHPHPNLERIVVGNFGGTRISPWLPTLNNLKMIKLYSCNQCEQLPTFGQLRSLEEISICRMDGLAVIGMAFNNKDDGTDSTRDDMINIRTFFPRLKSLHLKDMQRLRDWVQPSRSTYIVFPCLEELELDDCSLLVSAPTCFQSLLSLSIRRIRSAEPLLTILRNGSNLTTLDIYGIEQLSSLCHPFLKNTMEIILWHF